MVSVAVAILAAYLQRVFISAVTERDGVRPRMVMRAEEAEPELSAFEALRADAGYYVRQLGRRQQEPDVERKRLAAIGGVILAILALAWLLWGPA